MSRSDNAHGHTVQATKRDEKGGGQAVNHEKADPEERPIVALS